MALEKHILLQLLSKMCLKFTKCISLRLCFYRRAAFYLESCAITQYGGLAKVAILAVFNLDNL